MQERLNIIYKPFTNYVPTEDGAVLLDTLHHPNTSDIGSLEQVVKIISKFEYKKKSNRFSVFAYKLKFNAFRIAHSHLNLIDENTQLSTFH
jgi:hypothetical protein